MSYVLVACRLFIPTITKGKAGSPENFGRIPSTLSLRSDRFPRSWIGLAQTFFMPLLIDTGAGDRDDSGIQADHRESRSCSMLPHLRFFLL